MFPSRTMERYTWNGITTQLCHQPKVTPAHVFPTTARAHVPCIWWFYFCPPPLRQQGFSPCDLDFVCGLYFRSQTSFCTAPKERHTGRKSPCVQKEKIWKKDLINRKDLCSTYRVLHLQDRAEPATSIGYMNERDNRLVIHPGGAYMLMVG